MQNSKLNDRIQPTDFYQVIVECMGDEVTVADGNGVYTFANTSASVIMGLPIHDIVGKNAQELVNTGYLSRSVVLEVLHTGQRVDVLQKLKSGITIIATGIPIYDDKLHKIKMVIATSKNVNEVNDLLAALEDKEAKLSMKDAEIENLRDEIFAREGFLFADRVMRNIRDTVIRIAPLDVTVLIEGETGVGKDVTANTLHKFSNRSEKPFIKINCGSIPENLIESELFGYESGAFTGASSEGKKGLVEIADGGTLFLDEIGELPLNMQVKLLDFIQDGSYKHIGGTSPLRVDVRIVAATNRNLREMCNNGQFRMDLFYRLNVMPITIPPLRDRIDDIYMLVKTFLSRCNRKYNEHKAFSEQAYKAIASHSWPGNVRELEYFVERAFIMAEGHIINDEAVDLILSVTCGTEENGSGIVCMGLMPLKEARHELERLLVSRALRIHKTTYKAAEALGIDQSTIVKLSKRLNASE